MGKATFNAVFVALIGAMTMAEAAGQAVDTSAGAGCTQKQLASQLAETVKTMNRGLPRKTSDKVTWHSVSSKCTQMTFTYILDVNQPAGGMQPPASLARSLVANVCGDPMMRTVINAGGSYRYVYKTAGGLQLMEIPIDQCGNR